MPQNGEASVLSDNNKIHEIEHDKDLYEAFAPHVDTTQITITPPTPTGEFFLQYNIS